MLRTTVTLLLFALSFSATASEERGGIHQLWARRKIASLMDELGGGAVCR